MPVNHPFIFAQIYASYFGTALFDPPRIERIRPTWAMGGGPELAVSKSQAVFGESTKAWGDGTRYGTTVARRIEAPAVYGASAYGDSQGFKIDVIHDS